MRIGILALQGAVEPHRAKLSALGAECPLVRTEAELQQCDGLILPGGESTTLVKLLGHYGLMEPLREFAARQPLWGVCAGAILMAERVENPAQESLGLVPLTVRRNAYGRQNESFISRVQVTLPGTASQTLEAVFIRAPKLLFDPQASAAGVSIGITVLASHGDATGSVPIAVQHGHHLLTTFHPELSEPDTFHRHFISICSESSARASA